MRKLSRRTSWLAALLLALAVSACGRAASSPRAAAERFLEAVASENHEAALGVLVEGEQMEGATFGLGENPTWELGEVETLDETHAIVHATVFGHTEQPLACERVDGRWLVNYHASMRLWAGQAPF